MGKENEVAGMYCNCRPFRNLRLCGKASQVLEEGRSCEFLFSPLMGKESGSGEVVSLADELYEKEIFCLERGG